MKIPTIHDLFKKSKEEWLDGARATAIKLLQKHPSITIEDVLKKYPLPTYLHHNTVGSVFSDRRFAAIGWINSRRPAMHHRAVRQWTLSDYYYAPNEEQDCE